MTVPGRPTTGGDNRTTGEAHDRPAGVLREARLPLRRRTAFHAAVAGHAGRLDPVRHEPGAPGRAAHAAALGLHPGAPGRGAPGAAGARPGREVARPVSRPQRPHRPGRDRMQQERRRGPAVVRSAAARGAADVPVVAEVGGPPRITVRRRRLPGADARQQGLRARARTRPGGQRARGDPGGRHLAGARRRRDRVPAHRGGTQARWRGTGPATRRSTTWRSSGTIRSGSPSPSSASTAASSASSPAIRCRCTASTATGRRCRASTNQSMQSKATRRPSSSRPAAARSHGRSSTPASTPSTWRSGR